MLLFGESLFKSIVLQYRITNEHQDNNEHQGNNEHNETKSGNS